MYVENSWAGFYTHTVRRKRIWDIFSVVVGDFLIEEFCIWYLNENWTWCVSDRYVHVYLIGLHDCVLIHSSGNWHFEKSCFWHERNSNKDATRVKQIGLKKTTRLYPGHMSKLKNCNEKP